MKTAFAISADPQAGQKSGWYYDQRDNRAFMAKLARGKRVLDAYCYSGGFSVLAAVEGAAKVTGLDSSAPALKLAEAAAHANGVGAVCAFRKADIAEELERLAANQRTVRHRDRRSAALRALAQGYRSRRPRLSQARAARGLSRRARRHSHAGVMLAQHVRRTLRSRMCRGARAGRAHRRASSVRPAPAPTIRCIRCCRNPPI